MQPTPAAQTEDCPPTPDMERGAAVNTDRGKLALILEKMQDLDTIKADLGVMKREMETIKQDMGVVRDGVGEVCDTTVNMDSKLDKELTDIKLVLKSTKAELDTHKMKLAITTQQLDASRKAYRALSNRVTSMENRGRQCNVIMDGIMESEGEILKDIVLDIAGQICQGMLKPEAILNVYRIGKKGQTGGKNKRSRSIMVTFTDVRTRNVFYYARTKLKTNDQLKGVYLNDDVTIETKRARDDFRSVANMARAAGANVRVHDDGIVLNGTKYKLFENDSLPTEFALSKAKTVESQHGIFFHSESSYLSNFFPSAIWVDSQAYPTAEHLYQATKCQVVGELDLKIKVQSALTPLEAKKLADSVADTPEWRNKREEVMTEVINIKFEQNPELSERLLNTGTANLYETTMNTFFGIGATLHSREVRDMSFKGLNKLGNILQIKRDELAAARDARKANTTQA